MLFNSFSFFLAFLPIALFGFFVFSRYGRTWAMGWLLLASLVFYAWWSPVYLLLLLPSVAFNYAMGRALFSGRCGRLSKRSVATLAIALNLVVLAIFKYADFLVATLNGLSGSHLPLPGIALPIGISFFTFTQIAFLVDCYRQEASEFNPIYYGLFVTYFPHLIAGPILHHREMMPQFAQGEVLRPRMDHFVNGGTLFLIGLCKKILLADGVAQFVAPVFDGGNVSQLGAIEAWGGALAYSLQLYFDFSAYSDMAVGLSRMIGVELPLNFDSPYKATSIVDFWRRWHMTLSRFLRDYLYIPLGGNRKGAARRYLNLMITMLLGGLWHGANWTFVAWGGLHGAYLALNHLWREGPGKHVVIPKPLAWLLTFTAVVIAWVFFRADGFGTALGILKAMLGTNAGTPFGPSMEYAGVIDPLRCYAWIGALGAIALFAPNSNAICARLATRARFGFTALGLGTTASAFLILVGETRGVSEFLYFNF